MKKIKLFALVPLWALVLNACSGGDDSEGTQYLYFGNGDIGFDVGGGTEYINISSHPSPWNIINNASWLTLSPTTGTSDNVKLTVAANDSQNDRSTILTAKSGSKTETLTITQYGRSSLITFKDQRFLNVLVASLYNNKIDKDNDGQISKKEAVYTLKIVATGSVGISPPQDNNIRNMDEISYFTALTYLGCGRNELTSLDVSKNTALTYLDCGDNQLTSLDISKSTALITLFCGNAWKGGNNQFTSLDVSKNTALETLHCITAKLTSLDVSKNTALKSLNCHQNQLTSLDVSKNVALTKLECWSNKLTSLDVSKNVALTKLECWSNKLTSLDISKNTALTELWCNENNLTLLDVSKNTELTTLYCSGNKLTSLDLSKTRKITKLLCSGNSLQTLTLYRYHIIENKYITDIKTQYPNLTITYVD